MGDSIYIEPKCKTHSAMQLGISASNWLVLDDHHPASNRTIIIHHPALMMASTTPPGTTHHPNTDSPPEGNVCIRSNPSTGPRAHHIGLIVCRNPCPRVWGWREQSMHGMF